MKPAIVLFSGTLAWIVFAAICCHDGCEVGETRCAENRVQECNADGDWYAVAACSEVLPADAGWTCCDPAFVYEGEELAACVPADECDGGAR